MVAPGGRRDWWGGRVLDHPLSHVEEPHAGSLQFLDTKHAWFASIAGTRPLLEITDDAGGRWTMILLPAITP